jgi:hypothetical protein
MRLVWLNRLREETVMDKEVRENMVVVMGGPDLGGAAVKT